ncbi:YbfB/YjiJ family MFS transporter [Psychrobacter sp. TAE2020]|uniref:YbfB/YjiJ family MFS transporter n=1 Tax=Psychrobacter sp. TAE2020 TaxID=2846762 RepID=UPI001C127594|nr:YbfB/YjiJ family MFS transporter [Psychrobacter sp. TAE2020]MBU5615918.1 YbfB/YjiJ family MFS transporter [Psychrobacter sp. TAE2020]
MTTISRRSIIPTITNQTAIAWIGLYCLAVAMGYGRFLFTATLPDIMTQLTLSTTIAGWLASINYIGYFIGALIAMFVPQRLTWQALMMGMIVSIVSTTLLVTPHLPLSLWYIIRLLAGIASGIGLILGSSFIIQKFSPARRSLLSTVHYAGIGTGISASAILTWWLLTLGYHFNVIWLVAGITSLPLLVLLYAIRPIKTDATKLTADIKYPSIKQTYFNFKRSLYEAVVGHTKAIALLAGSYVLAGFGYITSATFLPVMATQQLANQTYAGLLIWLIVGIFAMLSNPLWGALAKRIGEINTLIGLTVLQAIGMFIPSLFDGALGLYSNAVILGLSFAGMVSMTLNIIKNINPAFSNLLMGMATLAYAAGQFVGPLVTVALAGKDDNFNAGLLVAGVGLVIGVVLLLLFRRQPQRIEQD